MNFKFVAKVSPIFEPLQSLQYLKRVGLGKRPWWLKLTSHWNRTFMDDDKKGNERDIKPSFVPNLNSIVLADLALLIFQLVLGQLQSFKIIKS